MTDHATNPTIADKKIRASTHHEKWEVFIAAKSNQRGKSVLALWFDPKLRRAAYAQGGVFGERLIKAHVAAFPPDHPQLFSNHEIRRQNRQLLVNVAGAETQHEIADVECV